MFDTEESELPTPTRIFANLMKQQERYPDGDDPWYEHSHHAVLGDHEVRLCGYKSSPELWVQRNGTPERIELKYDEDEDITCTGAIVHDGKTWQYRFGMTIGYISNS